MTWPNAWASSLNRAKPQPGVLIGYASLAPNGFNMTNSGAGPIEPFAFPLWRPILADGHFRHHAEAIETFFQAAVEPSCTAIAQQIERLPRKGTNAEMDRWESLRTVQIVTHQSFALSLGASWERGLREQLRHAAVILVKDRSKTFMDGIRTGNLDTLLKAFERVRGFPLDRVPGFDQVSLLYHVSSAVRHGDGKAAQKVYDLQPDLFLPSGVRTGWWAYLAEGGDRAQSVKRLDISLEQLAIFKTATVDFWLFLKSLPRMDVDRPKPGDGRSNSEREVGGL